MIPLGILAAATRRSSPVPGGDPHWANVVSLLDFSVMPDSTTGIVPDAALGRTWNRIGSMQIAGGRLYGGSGRALQRSISSTDFTFSAGAFTVEYWAEDLDYAASPTVFDARHFSTGVAPAYAEYWTATEWIMYVSGATAGTIAHSLAKSPATRHYRFTRDPAEAPDRVVLEVDGVVIGSFTYAASLNYQPTMGTLGRSATGSGHALGARFKGLRVTKGVSRRGHAAPTFPLPTF